MKAYVTGEGSSRVASGNPKDGVCMTLPCLRLIQEKRKLDAVVKVLGEGGCQVGEGSSGAC